MFFVDIENVSNLYTSGRGFYKRYKTLDGLLRYTLNNENHSLNHALQQGATIKIYKVYENDLYNSDKYKLVYSV